MWKRETINHRKFANQLDEQEFRILSWRDLVRSGMGSILYETEYKQTFPNKIRSCRQTLLSCSWILETAVEDIQLKLT